jgi:hypothetical protein
VIPDFEGDVLPPGIHQASVEEVEERFGWNPRRRELLRGVRKVLGDLRDAGCRRVWLDGSYVTRKETPGDFDLCWDLDGVDLDLLTPALAAIDPPRDLQKVTYGGDVLPNVTERGSGTPFLDFFQQDEESGKRRGIIEIILEEES